MILLSKKFQKNIIISISTKIHSNSIKYFGNYINNKQNTFQFLIKNQLYSYLKILPKNWYNEIKINLKNSTTWVLLILILL